MKRVFVSGASSGIGLAIAKSLSGRGDEVWGTARSVDRIPSMPRLHAVPLDLCNTDSIENAFKLALSEAGYFDVLINNAGSGHFGPAELLSPEIMAHQFQVLLFGHVRLTQLALAAMRTRDAGMIINVSSLAARLPVPFMGGYNAAKAALAMFTMSMQLELSDSNIRMVDLQPADIHTEFNDDVIRSPDNAPHYQDRAAKTWDAVERNMKNAPPPELVARRVAEIIDHPNPPPRVTIGAPFQTVIAPLIFRFLPQRLRLWGLKKYYGI